MALQALATPPRARLACPLRGPHWSAQSLPSLNPRHLFPRPARGPADGPRCLRAGAEPSLPPPPPAQVPARSRVPPSPTPQNATHPELHGVEEQEAWKGAHGGELWTLRLRAPDRAWVTRGRLRAAPPRWSKPRPLRSSRDRPRALFIGELRPASHRRGRERTRGLWRLSGDLLADYVPSGAAWRALIAGVPALLQPWARGDDVRRRPCRCWWPWLRCWWAQPATCTPERVSLG